MTLLARTSTVQCDFCGASAVLAHEIEYECDAGYPYNKERRRVGRYSGPRSLPDLQGFRKP